MLRFIITVIFGFAWWWVYTRVGAGLAWLMILGSVLGVCACCCKGGTTDVTWAMKGRVPFMAKLMSLVMNCDKMVGSQFEEGLAKLKSLAEQPAHRVAAA